MDQASRLNASLTGRYRIDRRLGEGGMATVYLALDLRHGRPVAVKVLKPALAAVLGAERFLAEINTTANLQHPHILPLHDSGQADGFLFYVMPYVDGESLRSRLDREGQLPVDDAVRLATNVAEALDYAHQHGVIHRDVKPENILLQAGKPVVADFGIALALTTGGAARLTETGMSLGTPSYMSPEQAVGDRHIGPQTDVYALGCVLYEMLAGEPPFTGATGQAVLGKVMLGEAAPVSQHRPTVPPNVDAAIRRALERIPADRFTGAQAFAAALADPAFRHGSTADRSTADAPAPKRRLLPLALAALGGLLAGGAGWALLRPEPASPVVRAAIPLPSHVDLETTSGVAFALSPDGSTIVLAATSDGVSRLWHRPLGELAATPIGGTDGARTPVYSPDGTALAFVSAGRLIVVSLSGGPPLTLVDGGVAGGSSGLAWSDDGWLYFRRADENGLRRLRAAGGGAEDSVTSGSGPDLHPAAIPGGRGLLFTRIRSDDKSEIVLRDLERRESRVLFAGRTARYAAPGYLVYSSAAGVLMAVPFDARRLEVTGPAVTLLEGVQTDPVAGSQFALSRTGTLLYLEGEAAAGLSLAERDLEGHRSMLPLAPRDYSSAPSWSPDGESVAFGSDYQIYVYDTKLNPAPRQVTFTGRNTSPVFSPDGRRIVFSTLRDGTRGVDLFVKDLTSDSPARSLLAADGTQEARQWLRDTLIVFESLDDGGGSAIGLLDPSDPERAEVRTYLSSARHLQWPLLSPDGGMMAYLSDESGAEGIHLRSFPDPGEPTIVPGTGGIPYWSPDGRTLYEATRYGRWFLRVRLRRDRVPTVVGIDSLFAAPDIGAIPSSGAALHPAGDRFILAVSPNTPGPDSGRGGPQRLIMVQSFTNELRRLARPR